ncbi:Esterase/lipase [Pseudomonas caricapapayae]|uniref:Esterase/lipase n=1 Tax=Pseudomonas caricapapayae TaxID=46678 RepID=A0A0P9MX23_9PSED|nr:Esterase/lipase [Pseudomonas caricapapayae]RMM07308.1 Esterase/lipase [Pseudomonas caricapapayae]RMV98887.1 Esterase/lipase [Pseudomonas caricapapayae]
MPSPAYVGLTREQKLDIEKRWPASEQELVEVRRFNKTLARMPRFQIRNRITPRLIQALLRAAQIGSAFKPGGHGLRIEKRTVSPDNVPVPVRIIRPRGKPKGVVFDIHGGGWVIGNAQMNDDLNVGMVNACNVAVVSVDYRLAVSTPIEGLMEDCFSAACWLLGDCEEFAGLPVIVVGESAGGHLAAATLLKLKTRPELLGRVAGTVLYYGVYDLTGTKSVRTAGPDTLVLDGPGMVGAMRSLTPDRSDDKRREPPLSPLYGDLTGLPPALMFVGEIDPLLDDTLQMAERWANLAEVEMHLMPESPHGFIHFPTALARKALARSREWINDRIEAVG